MKQLRRSRHVTAFGHMGGVFLYHDLYGYMLGMSTDVLELLEAFAEPADAAEVAARFAGRFGEQTPESFVDIFEQYRCLVDPAYDEVAGIWDHYPVKAPWTVWRREADESLTFFTAWAVGPRVHRLTADEAHLWQSFDGDTPLDKKLDDNYQPSMVEGLITRLVHHDLQALKLSVAPVSLYRGRPDLEPPYLKSTMPYPPLGSPHETPAPRRPDGTVSPAAYYQDQVVDAEAQFDHQETTLSHLLRRPHPALGGRSYGQALVDALVARGLPATRPLRALEIGGGLGYLARAVCEALAARAIEVRYTIVELAPALAAAQRAQCAGLPVDVIEADALAVDLPDGGFDLILSNEMIGDLPAVELTHEQAGIGLGPTELAARLSRCGRGGELVAALGLTIDDAPDPFFLTTGAIALCERIAGWLAPGGLAMVSEFGDLGRWPRLSTHLDHPELSIHFGLLREAAERLGLDAEVVFVIDLIDLDRTLEGMATTRSYFRALQAMLAEAGVQLEKIGYTRQMFGALLAGRVDPTRIGEIRFDRIEDRLMGLVPHEFKALVIRRRV
ncbi:MAG TPA: class I SAM-dependent methyltransferase [Kofleriaceae bacterium]|nr:class I SAM-dependent methyltransferase [Kofleriaceae bacterium]